MRVRMTQLPRLPPAPNFEILYPAKIQAYRPESGQAEATEWNCYFHENHNALLYLSVTVMDFNSFIKVRQKPVYHNQLLMPAIFCLLC